MRFLWPFRDSSRKQVALLRRDLKLAREEVHKLQERLATIEHRCEVIQFRDAHRMDVPAK